MEDNKKCNIYKSLFNIGDNISFIPMTKHQKKFNITDVICRGFITKITFTKANIFYDVFDDVFDELFEKVDYGNISILSKNTENTENEQHECFYRINECVRFKKEKDEAVNFESRGTIVKIIFTKAKVFYSIIDDYSGLLHNNLIGDLILSKKDISKNIERPEKPKPCRVHFAEDSIALSKL